MSCKVSAFDIMMSCEVSAFDIMMSCEVSAFDIMMSCEVTAFDIVAMNYSVGTLFTLKGFSFEKGYLGETSKFPFCEHKQTTQDDKHR